MWVGAIGALPTVACEAVLFLNAGYLGVSALGALLDRAFYRVPAKRMGGDRRFAILVPAHDEAQVIGPLLESLHQQDYPADRYQVFVVADNCQDDTALIAQAHGAIARERQTDEASTKGQALKWIWQQQEGFPGFDAIVLLDADNLVDPAFLREVNGMMNAGYQVVQGVRLAKNPGDSEASRLDTLAEALHNRVNAPGRRFWGLCGLLSGSGAAFLAPHFGMLVEAVSDSLVEDCEWQLRLMLAGIPIQFCHHAIVYDEKIGSFSELTIQRTRWIRGKLLLFRHYAWPLLREASRANWHALDGLCYLFTLLPRTLLVAGLSAGLLLSLAMPGWPALAPAWLWGLGLLTFLGYLGTGMALDGASPSAFLALLWSPVFARHFLSACLQACSRRSVQWVATRHQSSKRIGELEEDLEGS